MSHMRPRTDRPSLSVVEVCQLLGYASQPWFHAERLLGACPVSGFPLAKTVWRESPALRPRQRSRLTVLAVSPTGQVTPSVAVYVKGMSYEQDGPSSVAVG